MSDRKHSPDHFGSSLSVDLPNQLRTHVYRHTHKHTDEQTHALTKWERLRNNKDARYRWGVDVEVEAVLLRPEVPARGWSRQLGTSSPERCDVTHARPRTGLARPLEAMRPCRKEKPLVPDESLDRHWISWFLLHLNLSSAFLLPVASERRDHVTGEPEAGSSSIVVCRHRRLEQTAGISDFHLHTVLCVLYLCTVILPASTQTEKLYITWFHQRC